MQRITLELDDLDAKAFHKAIAVHQRRARIDGQHCLPEHDSCLAGAIVAEILRGWLDRIGEWEWCKE